MLKMDQVHVLRHKVLKEGRSVRRVAREPGLSRNLVTTYLDQPEPLKSAGVSGASRDGSGEAAAGGVGGRVAAANDRQATHNGVRLHRQLRAGGYRVGRTLVGDYWRERRRQRAEVYTYR